MEEDKKAKTTKKTEKKAEKPAAKAKKSAQAEWANMTVKDLKIELQKLRLDVKVGKEKNTSLVRKLKRLIAQNLTGLKLQNK